MPSTATKQKPPQSLDEIIRSAGNLSPADLLRMLTITAPPPLDFLHVDVITGPKGEGQIILPEAMSLDEGITWLTRKRDSEMKEVEVREEILGFPIDAARALNLAVKEKYGFMELKRLPGNFFSDDSPPLYITVPVDHRGGVEEVFVGRFSTPLIDGTIEVTPNANRSLIVTGAIRQKCVPELKALVALARKKLQTHSLYRGKAIKIDFTKMDERRTMVMPTFWDNTASVASLLLNRDLEEQIYGALWNVLLHTDRCTQYGIPLKRGILLEGDYGTGKTLCANITANLATENGWTFIYIPNSAQLSVAYEFARRYQPAVLFGEDIDRPAVANEENFIGQVSNVLDGVDSKQAKVILVLTTNHVEKIPAVLLRPGRIDAAIHFSPPDADTAGRLVAHYAQGLLDDSCDLNEIGQRLKWKIPAIIRETVERAKLYAITREPLRITTDDVVRSADMMERHAELCRPAESEPTTGETFVDSFQDLMKDSVTHTLERAGFTVEANHS